MSQSSQNGSEQLGACLHLSDDIYIKERNTLTESLALSVNVIAVRCTSPNVFTIDSPNYQRDFLDVSETIRSIIYTFNPATNTLIVKMPGETHVHVGAAFDDAVGDMIRTMGIRGAFVPYHGDHTNGQPTLSQHIEIRGSDSEDEVSVTGAPLIIPFHLFFLRNPVPPVESDISIGEEGLKEIGTWVWGEQSYVKL
ncbi:hypothetical protein N7519_000677 [Penicillium mononematosum]|uniref:uncharacterized protein n=1 Tax=Penicillium mononematosum TaxID=268346 RepID=UPI0025499D6C|nr:uncharacterized protein N7519_000677 [Penicillium mononematosum]KAJ6190656.1 hypothetical protein N7519_000677 [Penicillium mononematosum]